MISSILKAIGCLLVLSLIIHAQNPAKKTATATVSGKVTQKGNGMAGIVVGARRVNSDYQAATVFATTDQNGNYRMSNVPAGKYEIMPAAPQFVMPGVHRIKTLIVGEGDNVESVDFVLLRGGVITGKVTDAEGRPAIEEPVEIFPEGPLVDPMAFRGLGGHVTDDRGIYRVYGLTPGKYRVAAGASDDRMSYPLASRSVYSQTFHPSAPDSAGATVVELTEGGEVTNVDITLRRTQSGFTVTARVVDGDTGQPVPDVVYGLQKFKENGSSSSGGQKSGRLGQIQLEGLTPGKYALFVESSAQRQFYAEPVRFEIIDQDIKDLVIKTSSGSSLSGEVVIEGMDGRIARGKLEGITVHAFVMNPDDRLGHGSRRSGRVNADGSFTVSGLRVGTVNFSIWSLRSVPPADFEVARVERDGMVLPSVEVKGREQIKGLRLILRTRSGRIRGIVKFENGQLPSNAPVQVQIRRVGEETFGTSAEVDDRGRFVTEKLSAGVYEVTVFVYGAQGRPRSSKQQVVVSDNQVSEISMTVDLKPEGRP